MTDIETLQKHMPATMASLLKILKQAELMAMRMLADAEKEVAHSETDDELNEGEHWERHMEKLVDRITEIIDGCPYEMYADYIKKEVKSA